MVMDSLSAYQNYSQPVETDIKIIGDRSTNAQIVLLLACIRSYLQNKTSGEIKVTVGKHLASQFFAFTANDQEIQQIQPVKELEIN